MNRKNIVVVIALALVFAVLVSVIFSFKEIPIKESELPTNSNSKNTRRSENLYLNIGQKRVPIPAIELFERYDVNLDVTPEEEEQITSIEDFFIMGSSIPKDIDELAADPNQFELSIIGKVEEKVKLSYEDLIIKFEMRNMVTELYCMPSLTGVGKFSGPSLYEVIQYAKPTDDDLKVVFVAADGYQKGWYGEFPLTKIEEHREDFLLAVAMNGYPLAIEHGYPLRLALASEPGSIWVKWLIKIALVPEDAKKEEYDNQLSNDHINEEGGYDSTAFQVDVWKTYETHLTYKYNTFLIPHLNLYLTKNVYH